MCAETGIGHMTIIIGKRWMNFLVSAEIRAILHRILGLAKIIGLISFLREGLCCPVLCVFSLCFYPQLDFFLHALDLSYCAHRDTIFYINL